jgi:hypothetical protein
MLVTAGYGTTTWTVTRGVNGNFVTAASGTAVTADTTLTGVSGALYGSIGLGWAVIDQTNGADIPTGTTVTAI